jgi:hypothetical protein
MMADMKHAATIVLVIPVGLLMLLWWAWVFSVHWAWFFVPLGLPVLSVPQWMGIALFKSALLYRYSPRVDTDEWPGRQVVFAFFIPTLSLVFGYIVQRWML